VVIGSATSGGGSIILAANGGLVLARDLDAAGDIDLSAVGDITTNALTATNAVLVDAGGAVATGNVHAGGSIDLFGGPITAGSLVSDTDRIWVVGSGAVTVGSALAGGDLYLSAGGPLTVLGSAGAGGQAILQGDGISVGGPIDAILAATLLSNQSIVAQDISSDGDVSLSANGNITAGNLSATNGAITGHAGQGLSLASAGAGSDLWLTADGGNLAIAGTTASGGDVELTAAGALSAGNVSASGTVTAIGAAIGVANVSAGVDIGLWSGSTINAGTLSALARIGAAGPGNISTGAIQAGDLVMLLAGGNIATGPIMAGGEFYLGGYVMFALGYDPVAEDFDPAPVLAQAPQASGGTVAIGGAVQARAVRAASADSWTSGNLTATNGVAQVNAGGSLTAGNVSGSGNVALAAAGGNLQAGNVTSGGAVTLNATGAIGAGTVGSGTVLSVVAGGNVGLASASAGNSFGIAGGNVQVGALNAGFGSIDAAGLLTVGGAWNVGSLLASSNDIAFGPAGSISGGSTALLSTNATGAGIGTNSGAANGSYILDNGELSRIGSSALQVYALENAAAVDLMIGSTTLVGGGRYYDFGVVDTTGNYAGRLRVTGQVTGQNFTDLDSLDLDARLMEVDAVNGGIDFSPGSDATVGTLWFFGERVHVAEAAILDKLALDTQYANRDVDLATAPTAPHAGTVINVGTVNLDLFQAGTGQVGQAVNQAASPYSIYVQNMGTAAARSGLLISDANLYGDITAGSVEMIINGQLYDVATGQTLAGAAARDAFIGDPENDLTVFTASSSINGCALTGGACFTPVPPAQPVPPQIQDLTNQLVFLDTSIGDQLVFGEELFGNDPDGDDSDNDDDKTDEKNAIEPPPPVINGKPIDPQAPTDEPVSGSGNPALIGTGSTQQEQQ
jgi:filamentous hemagglutinin